MSVVTTFRRLQTLPIRLPEAWAFFSDSRNLAGITPKAMRFDIVSSTMPCPSDCQDG